MLDLNPLPKDGVYFKYMGSQTRPPCDEKVQWFLRRNFIEASDTQVEYLYSAVYASSPQVGNWRSVFTLNSRPISMVECAQGEPVLKADVYDRIPMPGPQPLTERELRATNMMRDALAYSKDATDTMRDLDNRLHDAAEDHVKKVQNFPDLDRLRATQADDGGMWGPNYGTPEPMSAGMTNAIADSKQEYVDQAAQFIKGQIPQAVPPGAEEANDRMQEMIIKAKEAAAMAAAPAASPGGAPGAPGAPAPAGFPAAWEALPESVKGYLARSPTDYVPPQLDGLPRGL